MVKPVAVYDVALVDVYEYALAQVGSVPHQI